MSLRGLIAVGAPLGFAYLVHRAISNAEFVDLDFASLFIYLFIALLFALMLTVIYSSMIRESFGDSTWMGSSISQGYDRPHWLLATTSWLLRQEYCFILRWTCFLAVQLVSFTEWAILYKRGMCASREGSWLERYFARHLYHFSNALDAHEGFRGLTASWGAEDGPPRCPGAALPHAGGDAGAGGNIEERDTRTRVGGSSI